MALTSNMILEVFLVSYNNLMNGLYPLVDVFVILIWHRIPVHSILHSSPIFSISMTICSSSGLPGLTK